MTCVFQDFGKLSLLLELKPENCLNDEVVVVVSLSKQILSNGLVLLIHFPAPSWVSF